MSSSHFEWIIDNIKNKTSGKYITFPHQNKTAIIEIEGIKLGIIGLATKETPASTNTHIEDLIFEDYVKTINEESKKLKDSGANAIIVLGHIGLYCRNDDNKVKLSYKIRDKDEEQKDCRDTDEAYKLLHSLEPGVIDVLLSGHKHDVTHHWINGFPVMSNDRNGKYASIVYLPFDRETKQLINEKIVFEGPLPICGQVFRKRKICDLSVITQKDYDEYGELVYYRFHDKKIEKDKDITEHVANKYINEYNDYDKDILTSNPYHFENSKDYETNMADFYTEFLRQLSGADIALLNGGAFRTPFYRGNITNATVHSFDPFGNEIVKFYAYGRDIIKILKQIQAGYKGFYPTAGLKVLLREKPSRKLLSVKLWDGYKEEEIDEDKKYSIVSSDFCFPLESDEVGGDDFEKVYQWFRPIDGEYVRVENRNNSRDMLINYLRNIDELKENKYFDKDNLRWRVVNK
jgi:2',3'-cyclic-nucleotide 2'-phosphodiesterase (5'-nucleotidase family)